MKKLVIIGANDFQNQLIKKAKELNYETHVFAWEKGATGKYNADYFYPIDIKDKNKILEISKKILPDGICSIASDLAVNTVDFVARALGLTCNSEKSNLYCTNKYEMRKILKECNIKTPFFQRVGDITELELDKFSYPLIVKPTDRSGSRGVTKVTNYNDLSKAITNATNISFEKMAIIEEFIDGDEYSCECISYKGEHYFLAFTKKYTTGDPSFIETGHCEPSDIDLKYHESVKSEIFKALTALKIENGASHSEFKIDKDGNVSIIEIASRAGGDCISSDLVQISTGYDYMKMIIDVSCGEKPSFNKIMESEKKVFVKFIFDKKDLVELEKIKKDLNYNIYRVSDMDLDNLEKTTDSSSRVGYYIYTINE